MAILNSIISITHIIGLRDKNHIIIEIDAEIAFEKICHVQLFTAMLFTIARKWKQFKCYLTNIHNKNIVHIHLGICFRCKKNNQNCEVCR